MFIERQIDRHIDIVFVGGEREREKSLNTKAATFLRTSLHFSLWTTPL
jgi:hypothetical protein